jgi:hypothetical protein
MRDCVILINDRLISLSHTTHSSSFNPQLRFLVSLVQPSESESSNWSEWSGLSGLLKKSFLYKSPTIEVPLEFVCFFPQMRGMVPGLWSVSGCPHSPAAKSVRCVWTQVHAGVVAICSDQPVRDSCVVFDFVARWKQGFISILNRTFARL